MCLVAGSISCELSGCASMECSQCGTGRKLRSPLVPLNSEEPPGMAAKNSPAWGSQVRAGYIHRVWVEFVTNSPYNRFMFSSRTSWAHSRRQCGRKLTLAVWKAVLQQTREMSRILPPALPLEASSWKPYVATLSFPIPEVLPLIPCHLPVLLSSFTSKEAWNNDFSKYSQLKY